ncbi:hypothetical protein IV203_012692 [Nitzschia inconspicua]|uniref:Uncharacterized protein n=1 Tax=Nitzschia inconspicua TaxID=303405 RepID=A0A9K3PK02_9STRA|nr:hypothetical protein IV203_014280 [Nitzschia inconspicua]KAG7350095.1 hypothetical protein IV203_012692 [Nitzschia inconspicua]
MEEAKMFLALGKNQMAEKALNEYVLMQPPADESSDGHPKEVTVNADVIHEGSTGTTVNENNDTATDVPVNTDRIDAGMDGVGDSLKEFFEVLSSF